VIVVDEVLEVRALATLAVAILDWAEQLRVTHQNLKDNPPGPFDCPIIHRLERVGFNAGQNFNLNAAPPEIKQAFERATADGRALVIKLGKEAGGEEGKGWVYTTRSGVYGVDYPLPRCHQLLLFWREPAAGCRLSLAGG
jgi:hypothetical protein